MTPIPFPAVRAKRAPIQPRTSSDPLAAIGNPEFTLSEALRELSFAAKKVAAIKGGELGEADAIREVLIAFRGAGFVADEDDGA